MVIEKLCLDDFRGIRRLELELKGKNTVLFGINGVGKSSVLAAINLPNSPTLGTDYSPRMR